jgi:LacI family transcriptional regulator
VHPLKIRGTKTIREIAREAGVSIATVSRTIRTPERVSALTRQTVMEVVERHDYVMHGMAGGLAGARSKIIGLVIPTVINSIYAAFTLAIQQGLRAAEYSLVLGVSDFDPAEETRVIRRLVERRVDGLILTGGEHDPASYRLIERHGIPTVLTWRGSPERTCISFDNYAAGRIAMDHLQALGHRRIGLICGWTGVNDRARERRRAYEDALDAAGAAIDPGLIFEGAFDFDDGYRAMTSLLGLPDAPTAVFAANDIQAIGALSACRDAGARVPGDVSILGFDDLPIAGFVTPKLTTMRVPASDMGLFAASRLLGMIRGDADVSSVMLPVVLVKRESTGLPFTK